MRKLFKSLLERESIVRLRQRVSEKTEPLRNAYNRAAEPVRKAWAPVGAKISTWLEPLKERWRAFREKYPKGALAFIWMLRLMLFGFFCVFLLVVSVGLGFFGRLPDMEELRNIENANSTEIYSADSLLIGKFYIENRTTIGLDKISEHVVNALVATEDRRFFEHQGIDFTSWLRVGFGMLTRTHKGGGSTLSQQLAKNLYPRRRFKVPGLSLVINKIRENYISVKLERLYSKPELLNMYLNTVPFGGDKYGISVAARHYFGKKAKDLTADEAAVLIGMLKATTFYNPVRNPKNAEKRRNIVLLQMRRNEHLTEKEFKELKAKPVKAKYHTFDGNNDGAATYFREYLRTDVMKDILEKHRRSDGTKYNLYKDGLRIYTTIDSKMQQYAEQSVAEHMTKLQGQFDKHWKDYKYGKAWGDDKWINEQIQRSDRWESLKDAGLSDSLAMVALEQPVPMTVFVMEEGGMDKDTVMSPIDSIRHYFTLLNCGFMAMNHHNGHVKAWVGGTNFLHFKFDHILSRRQVGSTFKPIVYAAALQKGMMPCDYFENELVELGDWEPHNADNIYGGYFSMMGALTGSVNVVAARLIEKAGIDRTINLARAMGVTSTIPREYGISLGAAEVSLFDMVKVYGTIANEGTRPDPVTVLKVTTRYGEVVYDYAEDNKSKKVEALKPSETKMLRRMLENVVNRGTGSRLRRGYGLYIGSFAGKTGTTQNQADGWFICFNPTLVTGAWVGAESPAVRFRTLNLGQGASMALPIVAKFWHKLANDQEHTKMVREKFPRPKEEFEDLFSCPPFVPVNPDTFDLLMQDTVLRDSLIANNFENLAEVLFEKFGIEPESEEDEEEQDDDVIKKKPVEKTKKFFENLLEKLKEELPQKKEKQEVKQENKEKKPEKPEGKKVNEKPKGTVPKQEEGGG